MLMLDRGIDSLWSRTTMADIRLKCHRQSREKCHITTTPALERGPRVAVSVSQPSPDSLYPRPGSSSGSVSDSDSRPDT